MSTLPSHPRKKVKLQNPSKKFKEDKSKVKYQSQEKSMFLEHLKQEKK